MTGRLLTAGTYGFDEVDIGDRIETAELVVTTAMIDAFAALTGDRFEIHMDDAAAERFGFPRRVAHGLLVLSLIDGLKNQTPAQFRAVASLDWQWSFRRPVLAEDKIRAVLEIADKRATSRPDRGILTLAVTVLDDQGAIIQSGRNLLMVWR